jgi:hypothetical protein
MPSASVQTSLEYGTRSQCRPRKEPAERWVFRMRCSIPAVTDPTQLQILKTIALVFPKKLEQWHLRFYGRNKMG